MRDLNVDQIKKLWILDLIIQSGSMKQASLRAKVSPSAISQSLSTLEASIGKPLLVRDRGTIIPTAEAELILQVVRPAFAAFERLKTLNQGPVPELAWLNFGTYESIAIEILPGLLHVLRQKMPQLRLALRISRTPSLLTMVRKGELCSALVTETDDLDRFYVKPVAEDRLGIYVSRLHPIADLGWRSIAKFGLGSLASTRDGLPRYYAKFMRQFDLGKPMLLSDSFETLRAAACAGALPAILPHRVASRSQDLLELTAGAHKPKHDGRHRILVVSQMNCDREEADFLAAETSVLLDAR